MDRTILASLKSWSEADDRKPLILSGARQVGKTWALKELGRRRYENTVHLDLERHVDLHRLFASTRDPRRLIPLLSVAAGQSINPNTTLLILDEIQACPDALVALKYFQEDASEYHVASAGSLIGLALAQPTSYPVGKVNVLDMYPMTFLEFLDATGSSSLADYLRGMDAIEPVPEPIHSLLVEQLRFYFVTGGMPEAVAKWGDAKDVVSVDRVLDELLAVYQLDFHKHAEKVDSAKIDLVWNSMPSQLSRENKKFMYSLVRPSARAREYESAVQWLVNARALLRVTRSKGPGLPLSAYDDIDAFKLYLSDVGMLRCLSGLDASVCVQGDRLFTEFKGALTENFVAQSLAVQLDRRKALRYWAMDNPRYEVDFLMQHGSDVVPIEVKAGESVKSPSLRRYRREFAERTSLAVRFSMRNLTLDDGLLNIPLYLVDETPRLIDLACADKDLS